MIKDDWVLHVRSDGTVEIQSDRVKFRDADGKEERRMKLARRVVDSRALFQDLAAQRMLPPGCRFVFGDGSYRFFVVEQPPQVRSVSWSYLVERNWEEIRGRGSSGPVRVSNEDRNRKRFRLAFPFLEFLFCVSARGIARVFLFARPAPLQNLNDPVFLPCITNYHIEDQYVCMGSMELEQYFVGRWDQAATIIQDAIAHFWNAGFNEHWPYAPDRYRSCVPELANVFDWEYWSMENPSWVLDASWISSSHTIRSRTDVFLSQNASQQRGRRPAEVAEELYARALLLPEKGLAGESAIDGFVRSATESILISGDIFQVGDRVQALEAISEFSITAGAAYRIQAFSEPDPRGRLILFEGLSKPCRITNQWVRCFKKETASDIMTTLDGIPVVPGLRFRSLSQEDFPTLGNGRTWTITDVSKDADSDVRVRVQGMDGWVYLTYGGGSLLPSADFLVPKMENPTTLAYGKGIRLAVGDIVLITGDTSERLQANRYYPVTAVREDAETGKFLADFGETTAITIFDRGNQRIEWQVVPLEVTETKVSLKDQSLDFGLCRHFLAATADAGLKVGKVYAFAGFQKSTREGCHPCDIDMAFTYGNETIPIIRQSQWAFPKGLVPCALSWESEDKTMHFANGDRLTYTGDNDSLVGLKQGEALAILCFIPDALGCINVVFENGCLAEIVSGMPFAECSSGSFSLLPKKKQDKKAIGRRYRYLGGHTEVPTEQIGAIVKIVEKCENCHRWTVVFDKTDSRVTHMEPSWLEDYDTSVSRLFTPSVLQRMRIGTAKAEARRKDGTTIPVPAELFEIQKLARQARNNSHSTKDVSGKIVVAGDIVVVSRRSYSDSGNIDSLIGQPGVVIHLSNYAYIYFVKDNVQDSFVRSSGFKTLPDCFKTEAMVRRTAFNQIYDCELLECTLAEDMKPGDGLRLKKGCTPRYGFGTVGFDEEGILQSVFGKEILVRFPSNPEWVGLDDEVEISEPRVGGRVRLPSSSQVYLGSLKGTRLGTVQALLPEVAEIAVGDGRLWYADPLELIPTFPL